MKNKTAPFKFVPFSQKQLKVLTWWMDESPAKDKDGIICDGSVRAGKTLVMSLSYVIWAMESFNFKNFIMAGKTIGAFRRNVLFWLKIILRLRGYKVKDKRTDNLLIVRRRKTGTTNYFYIFGGRDERSQDLVQGITAAGAFFDEVTLMPESFVNQAVARCSVEGSKLWFNCNPEGPNHYIKVAFIDKIDEKNLCHLHFTMDDNPSLSEKVKERYRRMFSGVFFQRYVLGLWIIAEGLIYDMLDKEKHLITSEEEQEKILKQIDRFYVSNDYGTGTVFVLGLFGVTSNKKSYLLKSFYYDAKKVGKQKADSEYADDLKKFIRGYKISRIIIPDDALSFIRECRNQKIGAIKKFYRDPGTVLDGIRLQANMLSTNKYKIFDNPSNRPIIDEYYSYVWDEKAQERGEDKPIKKNDHGKDMERYFHLTVNKQPSISFFI